MSPQLRSVDIVRWIVLAGVFLAMGLGFWTWYQINKIETVNENGVNAWAKVTKITTKTARKAGVETARVHYADFEWVDDRDKKRQQKDFYMTPKTVKKHLIGNRIVFANLRIKYLPNDQNAAPVIINDIPQVIADKKFSIMMFSLLCLCAFFTFIGMTIYLKKQIRKTT